MRHAALALAAAATLLAAPAAAQDDDPPVDVRLETRVAGDAVVARLTIDVDRGWKLYAREPGETGLPLVVRWDVPAGWTASDAVWPEPRTADVFGFDAAVYTGVVRVSRRMMPARAIETMGEVAVTVAWAACRDVCVRGTTTVRQPLRPPAASR